MTNYRPDPITIKDGVETILLPGGYRFFVEQKGNVEYTKWLGSGGLSGVARATHATLTAQADEIDRLTTENAELRKDAERYRWLRDNSASEQASVFFSYAVPKLIDTAIDAAMGGDRP